MKKLTLLFMFISQIVFAQKTNFSVNLGVNTTYTGIASNGIQPLNFKKADAILPMFLVAGVRYNSFGKTSITLVSLNHGLDIFFTADNIQA
jgi:hypothetical protein